MRRARLSHLVFALSLACIAALGAWWIVFALRAVEVERAAAEADLHHRAVALAAPLGFRMEPPSRTDLPGDGALDLLPCASADATYRIPAAPRHPEVCVQPSREALAGVRAQLGRRHIMIWGEGSLLFAVLGVCTALLWSWLRQERRQLRRMEDFVHAVTHEMKTPLTGIKSLLETLLRGAVPEAIRPRLLALGIENAERLEREIENLLVAGALRSGQQGFRPIPVALRAFLERLLDHYRRSMPGRPGETRLVWPEGEGELNVRADLDALRVIVENLLDNGFKYGGPQPEVVLTARATQKEVALAVSDRGIGFEPALAEDLFVPFRRALPQSHGVAHGTGLGLSIARDLAWRMGADLEAHSDGPGRGATFTLRLPRTRGGTPA